MHDNLYGKLVLIISLLLTLKGLKIPAKLVGLKDVSQFEHGIWKYFYKVVITDDQNVFF